MTWDQLAGSTRIVLAGDCLRKDPNVSGLIRLGDAVGAEAVHFIRFAPGQLHAAAGAQRYVRWEKEPDLAFLDRYRESGYLIAGLENEEGARLYDEPDYPEKIVLVVGSEANGLRAVTRAKCDFIVRIPQFGNVAALNVIGAAHVVAYEILRRWRRENRPAAAD